MAKDAAKKSAIRNALSAVKTEERLPRNVFIRAWDSYFIFATDSVLESRFIEVKDIILLEENSSSIALINLGNTEGPLDWEKRVIFLDEKTSYNEIFFKSKGRWLSSQLDFLSGSLRLRVR